MYENVRERRVKYWIIWVIIAFSFIGLEAFFTNVVLKEKEPFYVCAPLDMEDAFKCALKTADMNSNYKVVMTNDSANANVVVDYGKAEDSSYMKFAFSPFVVAYDYECEDSFLKSELISECVSLKNTYEIDLSNLIDAILKEKNWEDYGVKVAGKVKVAYPDSSTIYWKDFYDLMLIAANDGKYPEKSEEYSRAAARLSNFFASDNTYAILDFDEKVSLSGGFTKEILYIGPEKVFIDLQKYASFLVPTETVLFNYYLKADALGSKILQTLDETTSFEGTSFYTKLCYYEYRNKSYLEFNNGFSHIKGFRNAFNVIRIPEKVNLQIEMEG